MSYGLALSMRVLPLPVALWPEQNNATPSLQPHYRTFITTTGCSAPVPRIGTLTLIGSTYLDFSLSIGATGSRVPHRSLVQGHAAFTPDARLGSNQAAPQARPGLTKSPRFRHRLALFDASSAVRLRSPLSTLPAGIRSRRFRNAAESARGVSPRAPGHRRRSPAPGSHRTWRADLPHQRSSEIGSQHCERLQLRVWEAQFRWQ